MDLTRKAIVTAALVVIASLVLLALSPRYLGPTPTITTTSPPTTTITSSSSLYIPPPSTTITRFGCISNTSSEPSTTISNRMSSALLLVNTSNAFNMNVNISINPPLTLEAYACSYTYTMTTTPVDCGAFCGGIGDQYYYLYVLKWNFSLSPENNSGSVTGAGYNLTIATSSGMSNLLFPQPAIVTPGIYVNSQQITSWYSTPPCPGGSAYKPEGIEDGCMSSNATSITIPLPTSIENGMDQLIVNSSELAVP